MTHSRFLQWAYDRRTRHQALSQCRYYLSQNPADANLSISDLKDLAKPCNLIEANKLMKRITQYSGKFIYLRYLNGFFF